MSHAIKRYAVYTHPVRRLRETLVCVPPADAPTPEVVEALDALIAEWNMMYNIVYEAGELLEAHSDRELPGLAALRRAFAPVVQLDRACQSDGRLGGW